jgi:hypothetical protein
MSVLGWLLGALGPTWPEVQAATNDPQGLVDRAGPDALLLVVVPVLAWLCWGWGALGLLLTVASTAPGWAGGLARLLLTGLLPAGARRAAALALGVGLTAAPVVLPHPSPPASVVTVAAADQSGSAAAAPPMDRPTGPGSTVPDWPGSAGVPDWPAADPGGHVVHRGDCLWDIATTWLQSRTPGAPVTDAAVGQAVTAWWQANAEVIGPDPDLLLPGQQLRAPG